MSRRKKIRFYQGIRFRLTMGMLLLVALSGVTLYYLAQNQLERSLETQITADLQTLQGNTQAYVRQYLMISERNNDEDSFRDCAQEIAEELYVTSRTSLSLYTLEGKRLLDYGGERVNAERPWTLEAFDQALSGHAAYALNYAGDRRCEVYFAMPLEVAEVRIGIIGYRLDYSSQYQQYDLLTRMLLSGMLAVVGLLFFVVLLYLNHIINPIRRLSQLSTRMAGEIQEGRIPVTAQGRRRTPRRHDEISELSINYEQMLRTVGQQFTRIREDRVRILQLLDSRQTFYNNVTHELKTPLTTIKGYAQLLEENGLYDEELFHTGLSHIQHESARLHKMVIQLLEMSDTDRDRQFEAVDLVALLSSVGDAMSLKASRYQNVIRMRSVKRLIIAGKEERIRQLFINLIDNAIKYGTPESDIWVEAIAQDGCAVVRVINRGKGMTQEEIAHIFEPFYRTDKEYSRELGSAGLGLSICKKIVEEHGGVIQAQSQPGEQTVFTVGFPLMKEGANEHAI